MSNPKHFTAVKRGKTRTTQLKLVLHGIGRVGGTSFCLFVLLICCCFVVVDNDDVVVVAAIVLLQLLFFNQSWGVKKTKVIRFMSGTRLTTALIGIKLS